MFKKNLLISTALVIAATTKAVALPAPGEGSIMRDTVAGRNANDEFLCTYGAFPVSAARYNNESSSDYRSTSVAVPITGTGQTIDRITVKEEVDRGARFTVNIYSGTASVPGNIIAQGIGYAPRHCSNVTVSMPATTLERKKIYWVGETVQFPYNGAREVDWAINPHTKRRAYSRTECADSECQSSWTPQSAGPWFRLINHSRRGRSAP